MGSNNDYNLIADWFQWQPKMSTHNQLHEKDPNLPSEVHVEFFMKFLQGNFHQLTLHQCSILKWQKYPNSGKLSLLHWKWLPDNKNILYRSIYVLKLSSFKILTSHLLKLCSAYHIPHSVYHHQKRYPGIWNITV